MSEETALAIIEVKNPALVFVPQGLDPLLERIKAEVKKEQPNLDISTPAGRKAIASLAYKIAQSKTKLDKIGKELTEEQRLAIDAVNAERKRAWVELERLQDEVRKPLTEWEDAEKKRVEGHEAAIKTIQDHVIFIAPPSVSDIERSISSLIDFGKSRNFEEFATRAQYEHKTAYDVLLNMLEKKKKEDADQAELARLRAAEDARLQKEREDKIAAEAAAQAKKDAKAREEKAVADEKARVAKVKADEAAATALREKNTAHKKKINNEAADAIYKTVLHECADCSKETAQKIIAAIFKGEIPHVSIKY